jgi:hypothetical protein
MCRKDIEESKIVVKDFKGYNNQENEAIDK